MYNKIYSDFSAGADYSITPLQQGLDSKTISWAHGLNVEIFSKNGVCRQNGNVKITQNPKGAKITALYTFVPTLNPDAKKILYCTADGDFYEYDTIDGAHNLLKSKLQPDTACVFAGFIGGVAVCNGADAPFFYKGDEAGLCGEICDMKTVAKDGESPIFASAVCAYKSRLWLAAGDTLYFSALGTFDDWTTPQDAGYISGFHCDTAPVTALKPYKDYIAIYKSRETYLLSGNSPSDFAITPFADKGAAAQNAVVSAENKQFFFSGSLFSLEQSGILAQITLGNESSLAIKPIFYGDTTNLRTLSGASVGIQGEEGAGGGDGESFPVAAALDFSSLSRSILLYYEPKNQLWLYIPTKNNRYLNNIWIFDLQHRAWCLRGVPQRISCAANYDRQIISATEDGEILLEDSGSTFNGAPIEFQWKTPFFALGAPNTLKSIGEFYILISDHVDNNFDFCTFKDYDTLDSQDYERITVNNSANMLWASDVSGGENCLWATSTPSDDETGLVAPSARWAVPSEIAQKVEVSLSCSAVQFCIHGSRPEQNFAILALECKEILEE